MANKNEEDFSGIPPPVDNYKEGIEVSRTANWIPTVSLEVDDECFALVGEADNLREFIEAQRAQNTPILKDDVDAILQKYDAAVAISNDPVVRDKRKAFLAAYPEAGK